MSTHSRLILSGLVGVFALASCTDNPYDTAYDPYRRPAQPQPAYGATPNPAPYGNPGPYGVPQNPGAVGNPPSSVDPYGQPPGPTPYGQVQPPSVPEPTKYPTAERTQTPGIVVCPFDPNRQIDVSEFKSGDLARDRETKQIFRVP